MGPSRDTRYPPTQSSATRDAVRTRQKLKKAISVRPLDYENKGQEHSSIELAWTLDFQLMEDEVKRGAGEDGPTKKEIQELSQGVSNPKAVLN